MKTKANRLVALLLTLFIIGTFNVFSQQNITQNKIKSVVVYDEKFDKLISKKLKESETYYDSRGNITEDIQYTAGKIDKHFTYQYDSENNKIKETELDSSGRVIKTSEYKIEKGMRTEKIVYDANMKIKSKKTYIYTTY
ncbi:MAG: hypothetical protein WCS03_03130 [Bacteroidota bacterium]